MARALGAVLPASAVGLLPFTVFSTFLVQIADDAGSSVATIGGLRGLGGIAALAVGTALAPLVDRVPRAWAAAGGLAMLAVSTALGAIAEFASLALFCLLVGAATAVLNPALSAEAADRFGDGAAAGRAATLVSATQSLAAMLAAPVVALPAILWGWRGNLLAIAVVALLLAVVFARRGQHEPKPEVPAERLGYLASFRKVGSLPGVAPLLLIALLRTAAFMGYLAYLAAFYHDRFALEPGPFALVWTLSGASFFVGNLLSGRFTSTARFAAARTLVFALVVALGSVVTFYFTHNLVLALALTALLGAAHATVAACVLTLLVHRAGSQRGSVLSINAAGMSLGVFAGAAAGGAGLGLAGYPGTAVAFGALTLMALVAAFRVRG